MANNDVLQHYGVLGMKWGVRRYQNPDGSLTAAGKRRQAKQDYKDSLNKSKDSFVSDMHKLKAGGRGDDIDAITERAYQWEDERAQAKKTYKTTVENNNRSAVRKYDKKFHEYEEMEDLADEKWNEVNERYAALGKNRVQRMLNASLNKTDAAKAYNKAYDEASKAKDLADQKWDEVEKEYVNTGRNFVERILNNIKYGD